MTVKIYHNEVTKSASMFASVALDEKWSHLRDGDYVVKNKLTEVKPFAKDRERELRLWQATDEPIFLFLPFAPGSGVVEMVLVVVLFPFQICV